MLRAVAEDGLLQANKLTEMNLSAENSVEILDDAGLGLFYLDLRTGESNVSKMWKVMIGMSPDADIIPQEEWLKRVHPDDLEKVLQADKNLLEGKADRSTTIFRFKHMDNHWIWIKSDAGILRRDPEGNPAVISGVHTDVTEMVFEEKAKDEFVAMISHELRTPLTSVLGALKMANSGQIGELPAPIKNVLELAQRNSNRLLHLVNELLDFKSLESGELHYDFAELNARDVAKDAVMSMQGYLQDGQEIELHQPDGDAPILIEADVNRLQQILANLLSNAAKFSPSDANIELTLELREKSMVFAVRDHGPGVPDELEGRMFKRFTQAHDTSGAKRKFKSTGLGLSICKQMTEGMGGKIGYFNNEDGGATFWSEFPIITA